MPDPLSSRTFWVIFVALVFAVGFRAFESMQEDDALKGQRLPQTYAVRSTVSLVGLASRVEPGATARHWFSDTDFAFRGHWEHVRRRHDGRANGTSSRSFHAGSQASLRFTGRSVRLYGVVGPRGGLGVVDVDGHHKQVVQFYAPVKSVHTLVYVSPLLPPGVHRFTISVLRDAGLKAARARYVNIGGADIETG